MGRQVQLSECLEPELLPKSGAKGSTSETTDQPKAMGVANNNQNNLRKIKTYHYYNPTSTAYSN